MKLRPSFEGHKIRKS